MQTSRRLDLKHCSVSWAARKAFTYRAVGFAMLMVTHAS